MAAAEDQSDWPVHAPFAPDAPIPGHNWFASCDPDMPRVDPDGVCRGCGEHACPDCGHEIVIGVGCACGRGAS